MARTQASTAWKAPSCRRGGAGGEGQQADLLGEVGGGRPPHEGEENRELEAPAELLQGRWLADNCFLLRILCRRWLAGRKGKWPCLDHLVHDLLYFIQTTVISHSLAGEGARKGNLCLGF